MRSRIVQLAPLIVLAWLGCILANNQGSKTAFAQESPEAQASQSTDTAPPPETAPETSSEEATADQPQAQSEVAPESAADQTEPPKRRVTSRVKPAAKKQLRRLALSGNYVDMPSAGSFDPSALLLSDSLPKTKSFYKLCDYLGELESEEAVSYVLFDLADPQLSFNSAQQDELSRRISRLKSSGKKTIAWLETASNVHLGVAAQCDEILIADLGLIDMPSQSMETMFYKDAMDLIGLKASVVRAGDFKGAVEPYMNPVMSKQLREHYRSMLESLNDARVSRIARGRGLSTAEVRELQGKRLLTASDAMHHKLVTKVVPYGGLEKSVKESIGEEFEWTTPKATPKKELSLFDLIGKSISSSSETKTRLREDSIAVLHLQGTIVDGKSKSPGSIVSGPTVKAIQDLAGEDRVKGVVIRINSPGGSATASEGIRQALAELASKKPVVFSMGDLAASGGYWITCIGQPIYAEHGTITGSIGGFSMKVSVGPLLRRIGIHVETISLDDAANQDSIDHSWSEQDVASIQKFVDQFYDKFITFTSDSRKLPVERVKELAGGRVWSGTQAKSIGLIDEIGGLDDALLAVSKRANISDYKVIHRPEKSTGFDLLSLLSDDEEDAVRLGTVQQSIDTAMLQRLSSMGFKLDGLKVLLQSTIGSGEPGPKVWAMMPEELKIK